MLKPLHLTRPHKHHAEETSPRTHRTKFFHMENTTSIGLSKLPLIEKANLSLQSIELDLQESLDCSNAYMKQISEAQSKKSNTYLEKQLELAQELILRHYLVNTVGPKTLKTSQFADCAHDLY